MNKHVVVGTVIITSTILSFVAGGWWVLWGLVWLPLIASSVFSFYMGKRLVRLYMEAMTKAQPEKFGNLTIYRHDEFVDFIGGGFAAITQVAITTPVSSFEDCFKIFVGKNFYKLSHSAQSFVILHEIGHASIGIRPAGFNRVLLPLKGKVWEDELKADEFASIQLSPACVVGGLGELLTFASSPFARKELKLRMKVYKK